MDNNLPTPRHNLIGHRGVAGLKPENTLCSFSMAAALGLDWIEFDVQLSRDNVWVVIHDETLDRTTNGRGLVADNTHEQIVALEAGLWFRPPCPGEKVPTLIESLELARDLNLFCNVELKVPVNQAEAYAHFFINFLQTNPHLVKNRVIISTFDTTCADILRNKLQALSLKIPIAFLTESIQSSALPEIKSRGFAAINCDVEKFSRDVLMEATAQNIPIFLYTINDVSIARFWIKNGVTGIFTDRPDLLQHSDSMAY